MKNAHQISPQHKIYQPIMQKNTSANLKTFETTRTRQNSHAAFEIKLKCQGRIFASIWRSESFETKERRNKL